MGIDEALTYLKAKEQIRAQEILNCVGEENRNTSQILRLYNESYGAIGFHDLKYYLLVLESKGLIEKLKQKGKIQWRLFQK